MQRRRLLQIGFGGAIVLALAGGGLALVQPGLREGRLSARGREVFAAVARAVLDGSLPADPAQRDLAIGRHLQRLDDTIAGLPDHVQKELGLLLSLLGSAPGRAGLAGLSKDWTEASTSDLQAALQAMRLSSVTLRQQAYLALRELTNATYYADASAWSLMGYPGPTSI